MLELAMVMRLPVNSSGLHKCLIFCRHLGFKVHVVTGRKKTVTENNIVSAEESSWPAILVNDNWHFVDVAFAASVLGEY